MTDNQAAYFDPQELRSIAESIDPTMVVETEDFSESTIVPVGRYISPSREIAKVTRKPDGNVTIELRFSGGLRSTNNGGRTYAGGAYPLRHWISSKLFALPDRPGKTSSLAQYLKALGIETKGKTVGEMITLVGDTLQQDLGVFVSRTDRSEKQPDGSYTQANLKLRDFETGRDEAGQPVYGLTATVNGVTYKAKEKVGGFFKAE